MKTTKFFVFAALFCSTIFTFKLQAQVDATISPISLLWGDINASADFAVKENFSIEANVGYRRGTFFGLLDKREVIPATLLAKYYFSPKNGADGFYADGFLRYVNRSFEATATVDSLESQKIAFSRNRVGLGFGLGYKVVSAKGFVLDIGGGIGRSIYQDSSLKSEGEEVDVPEWGKTLGFFKIGIGYRFGGGKKFG